MTKWTTPDLWPLFKWSGSAEHVRIASAVPWDSFPEKPGFAVSLSALQQKKKRPFDASRHVCQRSPPILGAETNYEYVQSCSFLSSFPAFLRVKRPNATPPRMLEESILEGGEWMDSQGWQWWEPKQPKMGWCAEVEIYTIQVSLSDVYPEIHGAIWEWEFFDLGNALSETSIYTVIMKTSCRHATTWSCLKFLSRRLLVEV